MGKSYSQKLKNPKWQKRRLEILNRDKFTCRVCNDGENTLHVHHIIYKKNANPWEYEDKHLITLCEQCHKIEHQLLNHRVDGGFENVFLTSGITLIEVYSIALHLGDNIGGLRSVLLEEVVQPTINELKEMI